MARMKSDVKLNYNAPRDGNFFVTMHDTALGIAIAILNAINSAEHCALDGCVYVSQHLVTIQD
jgi:hypothetical protein